MGLWTVQPATHLIADWSDSMTTPSQLLYREIPLTQGQIARVSPEDYERLSANKWFAHFNPHTRSFYAGRNVSRGDGSQYRVWMHREILGLDYGDPIQGEHKIAGDTLNNLRSNLERIPAEKQAHNKRLYRSNKSGYAGVRQVGENSWESSIRFQGVRIHLGTHDTLELAVAARRAGVEKYHRRPIAAPDGESRKEK
jgi:hypothetical protein